MKEFWIYQGRIHDISDRFDDVIERLAKRKGLCECAADWFIESMTDRDWDSGEIIEDILACDQWLGRKPSIVYNRIEDRL